jgi:hypothetical protein
MLALDVWRKPLELNEQDLEKLLRMAELLRMASPQHIQVLPISQPHRPEEPPPHVPASIDLGVFRDPEAEVRAQPHNLTLHEPRKGPLKGVLYYTNTEANRRGTLSEKPRQRLVQDRMIEAEATVGNTLLAWSPNSSSGRSPGELARPAADARGAQIPAGVPRSSG